MCFNLRHELGPVGLSLVHLGIVKLSDEDNLKRSIVFRSLTLHFFDIKLTRNTMHTLNCFSIPEELCQQALSAKSVSLVNKNCRLLLLSKYATTLISQCSAAGFILIYSWVRPPGISEFLRYQTPTSIYLPKH